jgi:hypothetical protein
VKLLATVRHALPALFSVGAIRRKYRLFSGDLFDMIDDKELRIFQVIHHDHLVPGQLKLNCRMRSDKTRSTRN